MLYKAYAIFMVALFLGPSATYAAPKVDVDFKRVNILECTLTPAQTNPDRYKGFYFDLGNKKLGYTKLVITQRVRLSKSNLAAVPPDFEMFVDAFDTKGKKIKKSDKYLQRIMAQNTGNVYAFAYSPYEGNRGGTDAFMLTYTRSGSFFNFLKNVSDGPTYRPAESVPCKLLRIPATPVKGERIELSRLSKTELVQTVDNFLGRAKWRTFDIAKTLNIRDYKAFLADVTKKIEKANSGKKCGRLVRESSMIAKYYDDSVIGYRVSFYCTDIKRDVKEGTHFTRPLYQGTSLYFNKGKEAIGSKTYEHKGWLEYIRNS